MRALFDPLFLAPFVNGLLLAVVLALLGPYSRMRGEWLASLGVAQAAGAGLVFGAFLDGAATIGALAAAAFAAVAKTVLGRRSGNDAYAVMLLVGWTIALLLAANSARGEDLSHALLEGQLYFTGTSQLRSIAALLAIVVVMVPVLSRRLLLACLLPDRLVGDTRPAARYDLAFDVLVAISLALAATVVGVMAAFALLFIPSWVAFRVAGSWRSAVTWSLLLGTTAYVGSFALAIVFDQPYGPVLVAALLIVASGRAFVRDRA
jgi:zinc/manganese transport system permease protein